MEKMQDSSRGKTHQEDDKHQWAGLHVQPPVTVCLVQLPHDLDVAHDADHQWQKEAEDGEKQVVVEQEGVGVIIHRQHIMACEDLQFWYPVGLLDKELRDDSSTKHPPYDHTHPRRVHPLGETFVHERVCYSQVAFYADAGQSLSWAVQVAIETGRDQSTGRLSEQPVVAMEMVVSLEEEGEEKEEVGDSQAAVEDGRGHLSNFSAQCPQDNDVRWDPN